jgi:hypothetical protein
MREIDIPPPSDAKVNDAWSFSLIAPIHLSSIALKQKYIQTSFSCLYLLYVACKNRLLCWSVLHQQTKAHILTQTRENALVKPAWAAETQQLL